jgi:hypothetical protein
MVVRVMRPLVPASFAALALACGALGCGPSQARVCRNNGACGEGEVCIVGKCTAAASSGPVASNTRRVVITPDAIAYVTSAGEGGPGARLAAISLGASVGASGRILVKFPKGDWSKDSVAKAYLVLDRAEGAAAGPGDVKLRAQKIVEPWSAKGEAGVTWASPPGSVSIASAEARVAPRGTAPIRIDVTEFAVELAKKDGRPWGLRVEGDGDGYGVPIATGFGAGIGPRLEVFLTP